MGDECIEFEDCEFPSFNSISVYAEGKPKGKKNKIPNVNILYRNRRDKAKWPHS